MTQSVTATDTTLSPQVQKKFVNNGDGSYAEVVSTDVATIYTTELDYVNGTNPIYVGKAAPGTATSTASWQISKITYDGNGNPLIIQWAASGAFSSIWDNRASLSYS